MFKTKITNLPLEVVLGLLLPLHPVLDLQVDLGLLGIVPNDIAHPKTWCSTSMSSLVYSEVKLLIAPRYELWLNFTKTQKLETQKQM